MTPNLERLVGKAVADKTFRAQLLANPEQGIQEAGLSITAEEMNAVKQALGRATADTEGQALNTLIDDVPTGSWK